MSKIIFFQIIYFVLSFSGFIFLSYIILHKYKQKSYLILTALLLSVPGGFFVSNYAINLERKSVNISMTKLISAFASGMQRLGHEKITQETAPDDSIYLQLIEMQKDWSRLNPELGSIYTLRRSSDNVTRIIVGEEFDYNRDGKIAGEIESRSEVGEPYSDLDLEVIEALKGRLIIKDEPYVDDFGTWITVIAPIFSNTENGKTDAVIAVDYPGDILISRLEKINFTILTLYLVVLYALYFFIGLIGSMKLRTESSVKKIADIASLLKNGNLNVVLNIQEASGPFRSVFHEINQLILSIKGPISETVTVMKALSLGRLDLKMKGEYRGDFEVLKESVNSTIKSMSETLTEVTKVVFQVDSGAGQFASTGQSLSQGATESASSLEEITSSMNEIGSQTKKNAENSAQAKTLSDEAKTSSEFGNEKMKKMVEAMNEINQSSEKISKIIKVIDEIAFQTNLLALNAAVEAARAGKHGKGFAVVAEEVRNLAARSAQAAKETTEMIDDSSKKVMGGTLITQDTAKALEEIAISTTKVTDLVGEISAASNEQSQGISQIVMALGQIDQVTQKNTATAEESAATAEELSNLATQLKSLVGRFKLN